MPSTSHPFASPNAIPPRTSSTGILNGGTVRHRSSVLRPLSEVDWMSSSKKSKTSHSEEALGAHMLRGSHSSAPYGMASQTHNAGSSLEFSTSYPTPISPPSDTTKDLGEDLIYGNGVAWTDEKERILLGPYDYLYGHPGKDIRSQCIAAFNLWLKVPQERLDIITGVVGMLHTASLLYVSPPNHPNSHFH
jgi:geranylgeranyl diphosphate synthase, type III